MKKLSILVFFTFVAFRTEVFSQSTTTQYIKKYEPLALNFGKEYQIPPSVILGVAIVESGNGRSRNCRLLHNHFGVKGKNNLVSKYRIHSAYKLFASDTASYLSFCKIISTKPFYRKLKGEGDYKRWVYSMNGSHYSSAKMQWVHKIISAIRKFKLYRFDGSAMANG